MDRSGAGVNPTARWYSVLHLSSNFWAKGTQFPLQIRRDFFGRNSALFMGKMGIFQDPNRFPRHILRKGGKGIFQYFRRFLFMGGSIFGDMWVDWNRSRSVASYSPTKKSLRIHQSWGYLTIWDDRGASFRVKLFGWPRRVTIMVMSPNVLWHFMVNVVEKTSHGAALRCRPCFPSPRTNRGPSHHLGAVLSRGKFQPTSPLFFRILKKPWLPLDNGLDWGKNYRKTSYFMGKSMVSCKISLKPIHYP